MYVTADYISSKQITRNYANVAWNGKKTENTEKRTRGIEIK